jgi:hypothetical protein
VNTVRTKAILGLLVVLATYGVAAIPKKDPCVATPPQIAHAIASRLRVGEGGHLRHVGAIRSIRLQSVGLNDGGWLVSAHIEGPGVPEGADAIGTWATDRLDGRGTIVSVEGMSKALSGWGDAGVNDPRLSVRADEANASRRCSKAARKLVEGY